LKAAVLALKAGALREALKADLPRRSAEAIVVVDCEREKKCVGRKDYRRAKSSGKRWIPDERSPESPNNG
jgi:hypothetical protein